jgi:hypothetical protein
MTKQLVISRHVANADCCVGAADGASPSASHAIVIGERSQSSHCSLIEFNSLSMMTAHRAPCAATNIARSVEAYGCTDWYCIRAANNEILTVTRHGAPAIISIAPNLRAIPTGRRTSSTTNLSILFTNKSFRFGNCASGTITI